MYKMNKRPEIVRILCKIFTFWAYCRVGLQDPTSTSVSLQLLCRRSVLSTGSTICSDTLSKVCLGTFLEDR